MKNYYEILGIAKNASQEEISKAYRAMARKYHPDTCKEPDATDRFKEIAEAYEVLNDTDKRGRYDRGESPTQRPRRGRSPQDIFVDLFGAEEENPFDLNHQMEISFLEAALGCVKELTLPLKKPCEKCKATGIKSKVDCTAA